MTTTVTVTCAENAAEVTVGNMSSGVRNTERVDPNTSRTFHAHSTADVYVREVQPGETPKAD